MRSFEDDLAPLHEAALYRSLRAIESPQAPVVQINGKDVLNFSSNDYLGFANAEPIRNAFKQGIDLYGAGSGASRLVCGTLAPHASLETTLANFKKTGAALTFSSGYAAAMGSIPALCGPGDFIILDKLSHACLIDAAKLSGATLRVFPHNHMEKLEHLLKWARANGKATSRILVITESIFSMDGDWADLWNIVQLKDQHGALLLLDEAHGFGIHGPGGRGLAAKLGLASRIDIQMGTFSKAVGLSGGYLCGTQSLIDLLINRARSFIYSTAPSPALAHATEEVIRHWLPTAYGNDRRARLWSNLAYLHSALKARIEEPASAIIPLVIGSESEALRLSAQLFSAGLLIPAIRYPTVAKGKARLRIAITALHREEFIDSLIREL